MRAAKRPEGAPPSKHELFPAVAWREIRESLGLSPREVSILRLLFDDQCEKAIARELGISIHTVHSHLKRLYRKLHVDIRVALVLRVVGELRALPPE